MGCGKPDYWTRVADQRTGISVEQVSWISKDHHSLDYLESINAIDYVVDENKELCITGGIVSCSLPGVQVCRLYVGVYNTDRIYYDQVYNFPSYARGLFVAKAGEMVRLYLYNLDRCLVTVYYNIFGYLGDV